MPQSFRDLYIEELRDLYSAEQQILQALPTMASAAHSDRLKRAFEEHLEQTRMHKERLELIFEQLGESGLSSHARLRLGHARANEQCRAGQREP